MGAGQRVIPVQDPISGKSLEKTLSAKTSNGLSKPKAYLPGLTSYGIEDLPAVLLWPRWRDVRFATTGAFAVNPGRRVGALSPRTQPLNPEPVNGYKTYRLGAFPSANHKGWDLSHNSRCALIPPSWTYPLTCLGWALTFIGHHR